MTVDVTVRCVLAVLVFAATLASCGGGDGGAERPRAPSAEQDEAIADAGLLTRADLPKGWRPGPLGAIVGESSCEGVDQITESATSIARSRQLKDSYSTSTVSNVVLTFEDDASAERAFDTFMDDATRRCMARVFRRDVRILARPEHYGVELDFSDRVMAIEPVGSESGAIVWKFDVAAEGGQPFAVFIQHSVARAGRALTAMTSKTFVRPYRGLLRDWLGASVRRIQNELGDE